MTDWWRRQRAWEAAQLLLLSACYLVFYAWCLSQ